MSGQTRPQFSIVMPCYNSERTVEETMRSVLDQTERDLELIAVNDGSTDGSLAVLERVAKQDARVKVISQPNGGLCAARNRGLADARAALISLVDSDDRLHQTFLSRHAQRLADDPTVGLSYCRYRYMDRSGHSLSRETRVLSRDLEPRDMLHSNPVSGVSFLARREIFDEAGVFDTRLRRNEDREWLFRATLTRWRITAIDEALVDYRITPGGLSSDLEGMMAAFEIVLECARERAPELVAQNEAEARAKTLRYIAQRSVAFGHPRHVTRAYMWRALRSAPSILLSEPVRTSATLAAALIPGAASLIFPRAANA
jgi:glycosyltransferase involved in cell wall biosynthesis